MTKATITRTWVAGVILLAIGLLVCIVSVGLLLAFGGHFVPTQHGNGNGFDFIPTLNGFFWAMVSLVVLGGLLAVVGGVVQLVAWVGALVNTSQLADRTWLIVLLVGGLLGLAAGLVGFAAMAAYVIAGPDGMPEGRQPRIPDVPPAPMAPTS